MNETPMRALSVLIGVALVCSILVSVATISLTPFQERNALIARYRHIVGLTGLAGSDASDEEVLEVAGRLDARVVNLDTGEFVTDIPPEDVNSRVAAGDPDASVVIPPEDDLAKLGRRASLEVIYLVWSEETLNRVILPINGRGMWSMLRGFIALEGDLDTIAAVTFYEQQETAGLGDQIEDAAWQAGWKGRRLFGQGGDVQFRVASGPVDPGSAAAAHEVDGMSGATLTGNSVTNLVRFWFGTHGYAQMLARWSEEPPTPATPEAAK